MPGADPLFSQDSVKVAGSHLFVVNVSDNIALYILGELITYSWFIGRLKHGINAED